MNKAAALRLKRYGLAALGVVLIGIGIPLAILTPFPFVPIGLPVVLLGLALLVRNSARAGPWIGRQISARPWMEQKLPDTIYRILDLPPRPELALSVPRETSRSYRRLFLATCFLVAFLSLTVVVRSGATVSFDHAANGMFAGPGARSFVPAAIAVTGLGDTLTLTMAALAICLLVGMNSRAWRGVALAMIFVSTSGLVSGLKLVVHKARPTLDLYTGIEAFTYPSGHATLSALIYGTVIVMLWRKMSFRPVAAGLAGLVVLIGISRLWLGAHWASDVTAGWLIAGFVLSVSAGLLPRTIKAGHVRILMAVLIVIALGHGALDYSAAQKMYAGKRDVLVRAHMASGTNLQSAVHHRPGAGSTGVRI